VTTDLADLAGHPVARGLRGPIPFMWALPDNSRELPRFFAIMDGVGMDDAMLRMGGVDGTTNNPGDPSEKWGITRDSTCVLLRKGLDAGNVVERRSAGSTLDSVIARRVVSRL
jgi:hypothetical protein